MKKISDTVFVIGDDGTFDVNRQGESRSSGNVQQKPSPKRPRAVSIASSCTLQNTPSPPESEIQIIEPSVARNNLDRRTPKRAKPSTAASKASSLSNNQTPPRQSSHPSLSPSPFDVDGFEELDQATKPSQSSRRQPSPTAFDIDGFEELKVGPDGIINLDDLEQRFEAEYYGEEAQNKYGEASQAQARALPIPARNLPIRFPQVEIHTHKVHGLNLKKGKTVEFLNGDFLKIAMIIKNTATEEIVLRGWTLQRTARLQGLLPKKLNELCLVLEVELDDPRPVSEQSMVQVGLEGLVKMRHLVATNYPYPNLQFPTDDLPYDTNAENLEYIRDYERLVVRWKYVTFYDNAAEHSRTPIYPTNIRKKILTGLTEKECTSGCYMDPALLRHNWRGDTIIDGAGGSQRPDASPLVQDQKDKQAFECPECGQAFKKSLKLFEHFQSAHEQKSHRPSSSYSAPGQSQVRRRSVIEILDDDYHAKIPKQRRQEQIEDVRVKLNSILSLEGEQLQTNDQGKRVDVDLTSPKRSAISSRQKSGRGSNSLSQRRVNPALSSYTYGDAFCGAGGTTRGAVTARLQVVWGLDFDKNAGKTWRANFPNATHYEMWAHDLVASIDARNSLLVDILHLSPPCQVFSPVHTREGKNDQQNFDSLFACGALIHKARPRMITLEQTFGILHPKFAATFNSLIQTFTSHGYSVVYQIVEFHKFGLAQTRRRLVIIAACPGETLPEIPEYTHSASPSYGVKPLTSVRSVLSQVPRNCANHNIEAANGRGKGAWDASGVVPTITCNGGERGHPDGRRGLTDRELASLQSFPHHHGFHGSCIKKQIGNAVPPLIAEILFKAIIKHLRKVDKAEGERNATVIE
ncbi:hypothetical protein VTL71DRAFT_822 [Oculimacula yallundae]|uniref:DNA (cytosine-5-)-methyltransferase n=1 Tax=Oculimacula yallundae TaxID=86028 RepID=A0ABR4D163_9HELO